MGNADQSRRVAITLFMSLALGLQDDKTNRPTVLTYRMCFVKRGPGIRVHIRVLFTNASRCMYHFHFSHNFAHVHSMIITPKVATNVMLTTENYTVRTNKYRKLHYTELASPPSVSIRRNTYYAVVQGGSNVAPAPDHRNHRTHSSGFRLR